MEYSLSEIPLVFCYEEFEIIIQPIYHEIFINIYKQSTCNNNLGRWLLTLELAHAWSYHKLGEDLEDTGIFLSIYNKQ